MISEKIAKKLETDIEWNGRANVCVHCGRVPETFYVATGHDHTDYDIRWCPCREPNHNWCAGCSPDNCPGCGAAPVAYIAPQPDRTAELEAALREAKSALLLTQEGSEFAACLPDEWSYAADKDNEQMKEAIAKIDEVLHG